jgi:hypothetical protein
VSENVIRPESGTFLFPQTAARGRRDGSSQTADRSKKRFEQDLQDFQDKTGYFLRFVFSLFSYPVESCQSCLKNNSGRIPAALSFLLRSAVCYLLSLIIN